MLCKRCNNQMVWVGSMHGGKLSCEHCANDDKVLGGGNSLLTVNFDGLKQYLSESKAGRECGSGVGSGPDGDMNYMDYDI